MPLLGRFATIVASLAWLGGPGACGAAESSDTPTPAAAARFDSQIAPLLAARCLGCHNASEKKGGIDLTQQAAVLVGGDSGLALVAGNANESLLWQRIRDDEMPPKQPLAAADKALVREWITGGATWGTTPIDRLRYTTSARAGYDWWSLQPVRRDEPPVARDASWPRNSIDHFVIAKLEEAGLTPAPPVDRRALVRRLSFDLTGLPPSPDEVAAFVADTDPLAYEQFVERLLASPHYGQRWARHWLDLARFGESNGFEYDEPRRNAWPYRDWVIDALNRDLPFDEFARQQLAGDVLRPLDPEAIKATGFLTAGAYDTAGQNQQSVAMKAVVRQDELEDLVGTISQTFLGLTVNCARCHDHKFDPIRQSEYYQLTSALGGVHHGQRDVTTPAERADIARQATETQLGIEQLKGRIKAIDEPVRARILAERHASDVASPAAPAPLAVWDFSADLRDKRGSLHGTLQGTATIRDGGLALDGRDAFVATAPLEKDLRAKTLEVWLSLASLKQAGGGAMSVQSLDGSVFDAIVFAEREPGCWVAGSNNFTRTLDFAAPEETEADKQLVHVAIVYSDDGTISGYRNGQPYGTAYRSGKPVTFKSGKAQVVFGMRHAPAGGNRMLAGLIARAELHDRALSASEVAASSVAAADFVPEGSILAALSAEAQAERRALVDELHRLTSVAAQPHKRLCYAVAPQQPEPARLLARGDIRQPGVVVAPGGVASLVGLNADFGLSPDAPESQRRAALALWITSPRNPLFARVIVNRLWHYHFGHGLVDTPNDFGFSGARPSHPQLLDWLADRLVAERFSLKQMHRMIVLSAVYRQGSANNASAARLDADNRLLWCKGPRRLEAEAVRDTMLAVAGELNLASGGPGFGDCTEVLRSGSYSYLPGDPIGAEFNRRSVYRTWTRGGRSGLLDAFDCPDPSTTAPRRALTTTPLQALVLLNNSFVLRMSQAFARRVEREAGPDAGRQVARAYQLAYTRDPSPEEQDDARPVVERYGLEVLTRAIFNSNEFLYVD
jgi:hypothetical protein